MHPRMTGMPNYDGMCPVIRRLGKSVQSLDAPGCPLLLDSRCLFSEYILDCLDVSNFPKSSKIPGRRDQMRKAFSLAIKRSKRKKEFKHDTDSEGSYRAWDLQSYENLLLRLLRIQESFIATEGTDDEMQVWNWSDSDSDTAADFEEIQALIDIVFRDDKHERIKYLMKHRQLTDTKKKVAAEKQSENSLTTNTVLVLGANNHYNLGQVSYMYRLSSVKIYSYIISKRVP